MGTTEPDAAPDDTAIDALASAPTEPTWVGPEGTATLPPLPPVPPAWSVPGAPPLPSAPSAEATRPTSARKAALIGATVGALVSAVVASGVTLALDDDPSTPVDRPVATPVTTPDGGLDIQAILSKVQPSVVTIETSQATSSGAFDGAGSGIILSADGLVLTNAHVIGGIAEITVVLPDGTEHPASLVGAAPEDDVALIQVEGVEGLTPAELGSSDDLRVGDEVIAIGNALNLGGEPTVTRGIVSAKDRDLEAEGQQLEGLIQTDAAINPGNSGGPLVNGAGQVVGMNTAIVADAQNLGFSIAIDHVEPIIEQLKAGEGEVNPDQAFLGVSSAELSEVPDEVKATFEIEVDEGAFVSDVVPGSAAAVAGLQPGDVIVGVDGQDVQEATDVRDYILEHEPGDVVELQIVRRGEEDTLDVTLGRRGDT